MIPQKIEKPLSNLLVDLTIPPPLATLILDTPVGDSWIEAIVEFERKLEALKLRGRVKAARDLSEVAEGLRIVVRSSCCCTYYSLKMITGRDQTTYSLSCAADANAHQYDDQS